MRQALISSQYSRFADDMDALAAKEEELFKFVNQGGKASTTYDMEIVQKRLS